LFSVRIIAAAATDALCDRFDWFSFCTSSARMKGSAGPLQKLLHLANAREALASGDPGQALNEVDAALAADASFAAAHTLRADIIARMSASAAPSSATSVVTIPVAVAAVMSAPAAFDAPVTSAAATAPDVAPIAPIQPVAPIQPSVVNPRIEPVKRQQQRRASSGERTGVVVALGTVVIVSGVGIALLASGLLVRAPRPAAPTPPRPAAASVAVRSSALTTDVRLPAPARPAAAASVVPAKPVASESNGIDWASPRLARLNVHPRWRASAVDVEDGALLRDLGQGISELWVGKLTGNEDAIFVGGSLDENKWRMLRSSMKPTGVVWRIYSHRSASAADSATTASAAVMAGFARVKQVRYSPDYVAEQFTMRRAPR
jgi:hypothetical protein